MNVTIFWMEDTDSAWTWRMEYGTYCLRVSGLRVSLRLRRLEKILPSHIVCAWACRLNARPKYYRLRRYISAPTSDQVVIVTRKRQVTISVERRRRFMIREDMKILVSDTPGWNTPEAYCPPGRPCGVDAGKVTVREMKKRLDRMRSERRY